MPGVNLPIPVSPGWHQDGARTDGHVTPVTGRHEDIVATQAGKRRGGLRRRGAAFCLAALLAPAVPAGGIYGYTGADGGVHLSNVPGDARYAPLIPDPAEAPAAPAAPVPAYLALIDQAARTQRIEAALLQAVAGVESGHDPRAVSGKGAMGLMQLMPETARRYGITDPYDAAQNLDAGARHLRHLLERYDCDLSLALAAYNAGEGAVERHGRRIPPYRETAAYVPRVIQSYQRLRGETSPAGDKASPPSDYSFCPMGGADLAANLRE